MEKEFREFGLSYYESKALNLLLSNKLTLRELSKKSNIPFGKIYSVVKSLKDKELVRETNSRPKLIYVENASKVISKLIEDKKREDGEIYERLRSFSTEIDLLKGNEARFFQIGTTTEDNKKIQLRSFNEAKEEVLQILNVYHKPKSNRESKTLWERSIVEAVKRDVVFKAIYPIDLELPPILRRLHKEYPDKFQIKRLNADFVRCDIVDNDKVLIKLVQQDPLQFGGVFFIEDEKLANNLKKIFYELWERAED